MHIKKSFILNLFEIEILIVKTLYLVVQGFFMPQILDRVHFLVKAKKESPVVKTGLSSDPEPESYHLLYLTELLKFREQVTEIEGCKIVFCSLCTSDQLYASVLF